jgi:CBS domain-containing protein
MPIQAAAAVMSQHNSSSIFIRDSDGDFVGVVTDNDLRKKVTATGQQYQELDTVYSYLMQQRFVRQVKASIEENGKPDNYINPKKLSRIEQTTLKEIFKRIEKFQAKLSFDFTGMT